MKMPEASSFSVVLFSLFLSIECPSPFTNFKSLAVCDVRIRWTLKALSGRVRLGRVLMRAEDPVMLRPGGDVRAALLEVGM